MLEGTKKLFVIHAQSNEPQSIGYTVFYTNFYLIAANLEDATQRANAIPVIQSKKLRVAQIQLIDTVEGHEILAKYDPILEGKTVLESSK